MGGLYTYFLYFCMYMKFSIIKYLKKKKRLDLSEGETSVVKKISLRSSYRSKRFFSPKKTQRCSELCDNGRTFYAGQVIRNEPLNMAKPELSIQHLRYFHRYTFIWI